MTHRIRSRLTSAAVLALTLLLAAACSMGPGSAELSGPSSTTFPVLAGGY